MRAPFVSLLLRTAALPALFLLGFLAVPEHPAGRLAGADRAGFDDDAEREGEAGETPGDPDYWAVRNTYPTGRFDARCRLRRHCWVSAARHGRWRPI